jgi:uncharacterized protein
VARLEREPGIEGPLVQGFSAGGFSVDGIVYPAVLLTPERATRWDAPALADIDVEHLIVPLLTIVPIPEFLLLGTGPALVFPPRGFVRALEERGVGLEVMNSRAAARTWGLLRGEGRWIAAALMPLG